MRPVTAVLPPRFVMVFLIAAIAFAAPAAAQQSKSKTKPRPSAPQHQSKTPAQWQTEWVKHPEMWQEFTRLMEKLQAGVKLPEPHSESRILPLAPKSTVVYSAFPNYGDAAMQALTIFREELKTSAVLRKWWNGPDMAKSAPQIEDAIEKYYRISQYLGDEIAITAAMNGDTPIVVAVAEIKKPGLKPVLQQTIAALAADAKTKPDVRILDVADLADLSDSKSNKDLLILVRPDYLVMSSDVDALRAFDDRITSGNRDFASTPFGQRLAQAYQDHVTMVGALDLRSMLSKARELKKTAADKRALATVDQTGFSDAQYFVWEHADRNGHGLSQTELSFTGPRRGIAAWLAPPSPLGSLDFASPKALTIVSLVLENPAVIFDDLRGLATATNPNAFAFIDQMQQNLKINFRDDILRPLGGEITFELDGITPALVWKAVLRVNDVAHLQRTLDALLASAQIKPERFSEGGTTFHEIPIGSGKGAMEMTYAFVDGYLLIGSSPASAKEAVRLHRAGESLAKSQRFLTALPPGHSSGASMLVFQDPAAMAALQAKQLSPEMAGALGTLYGKNSPAVMAAYADEKSIRGESTSQTMDAGMAMIVAAVAIPNLLRSRTAANEATAVGALRTINTAQVTYAGTYSDRGFAPDLATLGGGTGPVSADHAGLVDASLGCSSGWCEKAGYRFHLSATCLQGQCPQYVAVASPVNTQTGSRNFCTLSDGIIRFQVGPPLTVPISPTECRRWTPLQ